jgi:5-methylcytosine-specific restriction endonuclease McrA
VRLCKREILRRDGYRCQYCGRESGQLTLDHIEPRYRGGGHSWQNLVAACPQCNRRKGGRSLTQAKMQLLRQPFEPRPSAKYLYGRYQDSNSVWAKYLEGW